MTGIPSWVHDLPAVNATLNGASAVLLASGYVLIRSGRVRAHRAVMISAFTVSAVFLICYLTYHSYLVAHNEGVLHYPHAGALRTIYLTILFTHTVLAATVPVLAIITLRRAWKGDFARHRRIARWTLPIWLYVGVTGVVVYLMLYQL
jgi:protein SCO1/2/putative membrane protein